MENVGDTRAYTLYISRDIHETGLMVDYNTGLERHVTVIKAYIEKLVFQKKKKPADTI